MPVLQRCRERPAYIRTKEIQDEEKEKTSPLQDKEQASSSQITRNLLEAKRLRESKESLTKESLAK